MASLTKTMERLQLKTKVYELKEHTSSWGQEQKKAQHDRIGADTVNQQHLGEVLKINNNE